MEEQQWQRCYEVEQHENEFKRVNKLAISLAILRKSNSLQFLCPPAESEDE
jgi:hypothetical protein